MLSVDEHKPQDCKKEELLFRYNLCKEQIAGQANFFDQIDTKTGIALGFTFVVVGQVLASVFRIASDQTLLTLFHSVFVGGVFSLACVFVLIAIICGGLSRMPRAFEHCVDQSKLKSGEYSKLLGAAITGLQQLIDKNNEIIIKKGFWAKWTYIFVGAALVSYLFLTVLLYWRPVLMCPFTAIKHLLA